jgi:hypothetical protein
MYTTRILVSNELQSYREAIAEAFRTSYPDLDVFEAEPHDVDRKVERIRPDLLVCSHVTPVVKSNVPVWVELYPECASLSVVSVSGRRKGIENIELPDLLSLAEQAKTLARRRESKDRALRGIMEDARPV